MNSFNEKLKLFSDAQRLGSTLKDSHTVLLEDLSKNIDRQITQYYDEVKKRIMMDFEQELDALIKSSRENLKTQIDSDGKVFNISGVLPTL